MSGFKFFSKNDVKLMKELRAVGKTYKEIGHVLGRDAKSIRMKFYLMDKEEKKKGLYVGGVKVAEVKASAIEEKKPEVVKVVEPAKPMSPREMIKKLYDLGYRIENNQLVCYVRQKVNMEDIISGGE